MLESGQGTRMQASMEDYETSGKLFFQPTAARPLWADEPGDVSSQPKKRYSLPLVGGADQRAISGTFEAIRAGDEPERAGSGDLPCLRCR